MISKKSGVSLIEVLIGAAITVILIGGAVALMSVSLRVGRDNRTIQATSFLNEASIATAAAIIESSWPTGYQFAVPTGAPGYFSTDIQSYTRCNECLHNPASCVVCVQSGGDESGLCIAGGNQCVLTYEPCEASSFTSQQLNRFYSITFDGTEYFICYKVEYVGRSGDAIAASSGITDPANDAATMKVFTKVRWGSAGQYESSPLITYLTRHGSEVARQTDWSGGPGQSRGWILQNKFDTSNGVTVSVPGQITTP